MSGIAAIVQLGFKVAQGLGAYIGAARGAKKSVEKVESEVLLISNMLNAIGSILSEGNDGTVAKSQCSIHLIEMMDQCLERCTEVFETINNLLDKCAEAKNSTAMQLHRNVGIRGQLKWKSIDVEISEHRNTIHEEKLNLNLILSVMSAAALRPHWKDIPETERKTMSNNLNDQLATSKTPSIRDLVVKTGGSVFTGSDDDFLEDTRLRSKASKGNVRDLNNNVSNKNNKNDVRNPDNSHLSDGLNTAASQVGENSGNRKRNGGSAHVRFQRDQLTSSLRTETFITSFNVQKDELKYRQERFDKVKDTLRQMEKQGMQTLMNEIQPKENSSLRAWTLMIQPQPTLEVSVIQVPLSQQEIMGKVLFFQNVSRHSALEIVQNLYSTHRQLILSHANSLLGSEEGILAIDQNQEQNIEIPCLGKTKIAIPFWITGVLKNDMRSASHEKLYSYDSSPFGYDAHSAYNTASPTYAARIPPHMSHQQERRGFMRGLRAAELELLSSTENSSVDSYDYITPPSIARRRPRRSVAATRSKLFDTLPKAEPMNSRNRRNTMQTSFDKFPRERDRNRQTTDYTRPTTSNLKSDQPRY